MNVGKKIFLHLLLYSGLKMCEPSVFEKAAYHKSQVTNPQQKENCICYVNDEKLPLVSEIIETTNFAFERLVVYFYKDFYTQKITMYIPNLVKQYLIPDLPYESDDSLTYPPPTGTIHDLVNTNVQRIIINAAYEGPGSIVSSVDALPPIDHELVANIDWDNGIVEVDGQSVNIALPDVFYNPIAQASIIPEDDVTNYVAVATSETITTNNNEMANYESNIADMYIENIINKPAVPFEYVPSNNPFISYDKVIETPQKHIEDNGNMNKWIEQQIINTDGNLNNIDVDSLRMMIMQTLLKNKISVSPDGLLIDAWGSLLDPSNLIIRPILLDSSVGYNHLLQNFLEAYVISLKNPPKVLGIIPLAKTYLPRPITYSTTMSKLNCLKGKCLPEASVNNTEHDTPKLDNRIIPGRFDVGEKKLTPNGVSKKFLYQLPVINAAASTDYPVRNDMLDEDGPGVRIVGGSAATGSGTPVSNKGRSGALPNNIRLT